MEDSWIFISASELRVLRYHISCIFRKCHHNPEWMCMEKADNILVLL